MSSLYSRDVAPDVILRIDDLDFDSIFDTLLSDADVKKLIRTLPGIQKPDQLPRILRMDGITESKIGFVSCLGTNAVLAERIISAFHHFNSENIRLIVFICDSKEVAWWKHNSQRPVKSKSSGNRSNAANLIQHLEMLNWAKMPLAVYSIENREATDEFQKFNYPY